MGALPTTVSAVALLAAALLAGCSGEALDPAPPPRPEGVVNEQRSHEQAQTDAEVVTDRPTLFRTTDVLPDLDVRSLAIAAGRVWAGTASGLYLLALDGASFEARAIGGTGPVVDTSTLPDGRLLALRADAVERLDVAGGSELALALTGFNARAVAGRGADVYVAGDEGLFRVDSMGAQQIVGPMAIRDVVIVGDVAWLATATGVARYDFVTNAALSTLTAPEHLVDDDVRSLAQSSTGDAVLAASNGGHARIALDASGAELVLVGLDALPSGDLRAVAEQAGEVLSGHGIGATAIGPSRKDHYHSLRWIPAEEVRAVALGADGTRWIGTSAGVARIDLVMDTVAAKAQVFEAMTTAHWRMDGFVADSVVYADEWDHVGEPSRSDNDNDGLWTEMQVAAWCFGYAVTGDAAFYDNARRAMDVMLLLHDVPGETFAAAGFDRGFITRSLVRSDEGAVFDDKTARVNWHRQDSGAHTYHWKDDTSADEYTGHFFGIPVFYDLCARSDAEREAIRERMDSVMRYLAKHDYELIDLDGAPTQHGDWKGLANAVDGMAACAGAGLDECGESYAGGGWLNSIQILGALLATWHITGDDFFYDEYERLAVQERYGEMIPLTIHTLNVTVRGSANHSDHELAALAYFTLLRYEPNSDRREVWIQSLRDLYGYEAPERNALLIAVMASAMADAPIVDAVRTLREMPRDWREWLVDNAHREDVERDTDDRFDDAQFKTVLPYDEIRTMKWNGNPYVVAGGNTGQSVQAPWPFLLPYWMLRHYGALE